MLFEVIWMKKCFRKCDQGTALFRNLPRRWNVLSHLGKWHVKTFSLPDSLLLASKLSSEDDNGEETSVVFGEGRLSLGEDRTLRLRLRDCWLRGDPKERHLAALDLEDAAEEEARWLASQVIEDPSCCL